MMEARAVGWDLAACAAAQGTDGFAALCGAVAISDRAGACNLCLCYCQHCCLLQELPCALSDVCYKVAPITLMLTCCLLPGPLVAPSRFSVVLDDMLVWQSQWIQAPHNVLPVSFDAET